MTVTTEAAAAADASAEDNAAGGNGDDSTVVDTSIDGESGGATPEEIAQVLSKSGFKNTTTTNISGEAAAEEAEVVEDDAAVVDEPVVVDTPVVADKPVVATVDKPADAAVVEPPKFTLEVEDADGNKFEIAKIDDLPEDFSPKTNRQGLEILDRLQELKAAKATYDKEQETATSEAAKAEQVAKIQEGWQTEFKELGVTTKAEQDKVFDYMRAENAKREEQGRPWIASIEDAKNGMDATAAREAAAEAAKAAKEEARRKGGLIGGGSAPGGAGSAPVYRGGARNAVEAARSMNLF